MGIKEEGMEAMERKKSLKEGGNKPMGKEAAKGGK